MCRVAPDQLMKGVVIDLKRLGDKKERCP